MKSSVLTCGVILLLAVAGPASAQQDFRGVLSPNGHDFWVDTLIISHGTEMETLAITGWGGDSTVPVDSADLPDMIWPACIDIRCRVDGTRSSQVIIAPVQEQWYRVEAGSPPTPKIMFYMAAGVEELPGTGTRPALSVTPSVLTGRVLVRGQATGGRPVSLAVFDATGSPVRSLHSAPDPATGVLEAVWHGRDDEGRVLPEGVYFCRLATGGAVAVRKVLIVR